MSTTGWIDTKEDVVEYEEAKDAACEWQSAERLAAITGKSVNTIRAYCSPCNDDRPAARFYERRRATDVNAYEYRIKPSHLARFFRDYATNRTVSDWQTARELAALVGADPDEVRGDALEVSVQKRPVRDTDPVDEGDTSHMYRIPAAELVEADAPDLVDQADEASPMERPQVDVAPPNVGMPDEGSGDSESVDPDDLRFLDKHRGNRLAMAAVVLAIGFAIIVVAGFLQAGGA